MYNFKVDKDILYITETTKNYNRGFSINLNEVTKEEIQKLISILNMR